MVSQLRLVAADCHFDNTAPLNTPPVRVEARRATHLILRGVELFKTPNYGFNMYPTPGTVTT